MSAQALYRKWRPQTFDAVVGQEHVTRTLRNALRSGRIGHAYLLAGPRGTGKTTTARLLAKAVNCLAESPANRPCNDCAICRALNEGRLLDLIEIDAASNRGIDEIRELRERVGFRPNEARYKVYVIDEVHMLTEPAFNALLKTLEEPPPHVIFVLATTEPHKIPETILSRCQRFDFRRLTVEEIFARLADLAAWEGQAFEAEALRAIARHGAGSIRDAESLLDQLMACGDEVLTLDQVQAVLGTGSQQVVSGLIQHLVSGDVGGGLEAINRAIDSGIAPGQFNRQVVEYLRGLMLILVGDGGQWLDLSDEELATARQLSARLSLRQVVRALKSFNEAGQALKGSLFPQLPLELAFIEATTTDPNEQPAPSHEISTPASAQPAGKTRVLPPTTATVAAAAPAYVVSPPVQESKPDAPPSPVAAQEGALSLELLRLHWAEVFQVLRSQNLFALEALLRDGWPERVEGRTVVIGFDAKRTFHKTKLSEVENRRRIEEAVGQVTGQACRIECALIAHPAPAAAESKKDRGQAQLPPAPGPQPPDVTQDPVIQAAIEELGAQVVDIRDNT